MFKNQMMNQRERKHKLTFQTISSRRRNLVRGRRFAKIDDEGKYGYILVSDVTVQAVDSCFVRIKRDYVHPEARSQLRIPAAVASYVEH